MTRYKTYMLATCRKPIELFHVSYIRIIHPTCERVLAHVRDTCLYFWGIYECVENVSELTAYLFRPQ